MYTSVTFEARVAIGIGGVAVISLSEKCAKGWAMDKGEKLECVKDDITNDGDECWLEYMGIETPEKDGIYSVRGNAAFSEDDSVYHDVVFEVE